MIFDCFFVNIFSWPTQIERQPYIYTVKYTSLSTGRSYDHNNDRSPEMVIMMSYYIYVIILYITYMKNY